MQKILRLLESDHAVELRRAAALVVGEVGHKDAEIGAALGQAMNDPDVDVRLEAIRAVGKLKIDKALGELLGRVQKGGAEAPPAAVAAACMGTRGLKALQDLMHEVAPGLRRVIAGALAGADQAKTDTGRLGVLFDTDPAVVHAAARSLLEKVPTLSPQQRKGLADQVLDSLGGPRSRGNISSTTASSLVRLLSALDDPRAEPYLWQRIAPDQPAEVRAAALQALGKRPLSQTKDHVKKLLACAQDRDFAIVAPALLLLKTVPLTKKTLGEWLPLFDAPDVAVRHFALEHLGTLDAPQVAEGLVAQLDHADQHLRESALDRLAKLPSGQKALTKALFAEEKVDRAWIFARALGNRVQEFPPAWRKEVFQRIGHYLEAGDHRADPLLYLLRHADAKHLRDMLEERGLALRKKKDYEKALHYLRILGKDPACAFATRLELAGCGLKLANHEAGPEGSPALNQFEALCRHFGDDLTEAVTGLKWLDNEDLYFLGFHLAGKEGLLRRFAEKMLQLVLKRGGRSKIAQQARHKLRNEGLAEK